MSANDEHSTKRPLFFVRPAECDDATGIADAIADALIEQINAHRASRGLPPLLETTENRRKR